MSSLITLSRQAQTFLLTPSPVLGFPWMDVIGVPRLSIILDQVFRQVNKGKGVGKERPGFGAELATILTLVLTGDTLLHLLLPLTTPVPGFFSSPTVFLLFGTVHFALTQTPLQGLLPDKAPFWWEALAAVNDGLGRALVVGLFVADGLVQREGLWTGGVKGGLGWWGIVLAGWVGVYGGGFLVNMFDMFSSQWRFQTPPELKPWGWLTMDFWVPPVATLLYLLLTSPQRVALLPSHPLSPFNPIPHTVTQTQHFLSPYGILGEKPVYLVSAPWSKEDARALLGVLISGLFIVRAVWQYYGAQITEALVGGKKVVVSEKKKMQ